VSINLDEIARQKQVDAVAMRIAAMEFAVRGRREKDAPLVQLAEEVFEWLNGE
jgi:hypothetical protein